jgi:hypothetical protein
MAFIYFVLSILGLFLAAQFIIALFMQGFIEHSANYAMIKPVLELLETVTNLLTFPLRWLYMQLALPTFEYFPLTKAAPVFEAIGKGFANLPLITDIPGIHALDSFPYSKVFTGSFDWLLVIAQSLLASLERGLRWMTGSIGGVNKKRNARATVVARRKEITENFERDAKNRGK